MSADAAAKNAEMVKLQNQVKTLKTQKGKPQTKSFAFVLFSLGKEEEIADLQKQIDQCSEDLANLMAPQEGTPTSNQKVAICRYYLFLLLMNGQFID